MRRSLTAAIAVGAAGVLAVTTAAPVSAAHISDPLASGLAGPLSLAVGHDGTLYVAQSFAGMLTAIDPDGTRRTLATVGEGGDIAGVDASRKASVWYTTTTFGETGTVAAQLRRLASDGGDKKNADLWEYEQTVNPDGHVRYGFSDLPDGCTDVPVPGGATGYTGILDAHPYAVAIRPGGFRVVADAGGNSLVQVNPNRTIRTIAVLPPQPLEITAEVREIINEIIAGEGGPPLPECVVGSTYLFEGVPTDVEVGPNGQLYVTTLPGGLEDPRLGAQGSVYRVSPKSGSMKRLGTGFAGATGVAVSPDGDVYVAELFGGRISKLVDGGPQTVAEMPLPAAVEWAHGKLYATYDVFGDGKIVSITP